MKSTVAIIANPDAVYSRTPPFGALREYPECPRVVRPGEDDRVYDMVRESFLALGLDRERFGTPAWNPLGRVVRPGETVFIKPNMISHKHALNDDWDYVITHGSVIRAVVDYVYIALEGQGRILIGDAPQTDSDFGAIIERMGLPRIQALYRDAKGFSIEILDLREEHWIEKDGIYTEREALPGDPQGRVRVDLGEGSCFAEKDVLHPTYYGAFYDLKETNRHHSNGHHEYSVAKSPILADVFINVPKLKTHKKCGLTVNLKSLVGIACDKNWLPHYVLGGPSQGGDQFAHATWKQGLENAIVVRGKQWLLGKNRFVKWIARKTKKSAYSIFGDTEAVVRSGNWHGNDTVWRMCLDLNRILMFANPDGSLRDPSSSKRFFSVVDGIAAMEGNGPVAGTRRAAGLIIAGDNPVAVDAVCASVMGFDPSRLPLVAAAFGDHRLPLFQGSPDDITPVCNEPKWNRPLSQWKREDTLQFKPHFGWVGAVERKA